MALAQLTMQPRGAEVGGSTRTHLDYGSIDLKGLASDLPPTCDLYIERHGRFVLYREASFPFKTEDRERLVASGVTNLWVRLAAENDGDPRQPLMTLLTLPDDLLSPPAKASLLHSSAMAVARRAIRDTLTCEALEGASDLIGATVSYLARSRAAFPAMLSALRHDFSLYSHSVNVGIYAIGLGRFIGITDGKELQELGLSAFLHDVGKARVPRKVLEKPGPLNGEEWMVMRQHPTWGNELLAETDDLPEEVLLAVSQHHERVDGSGYPSGTRGPAIHPYSLVIAVVDAFDAITSTRPYRPGRSPFAALSVLRGEAGNKLDANMFIALVHLLGNPAQAFNAGAIGIEQAAKSTLAGDVTMTLTG